MKIFNNLSKYNILLASNSPRRRELLSGLDIAYEVVALPDVDESYPVELVHSEIPTFISRQKAAAYQSHLEENTLLITADTIVWLDGEVFGKPVDEEEAVSMLSALSGKTHEVITGVCLTSKNKQSAFHVTSSVRFAELDEAEIRSALGALYRVTQANWILDKDTLLTLRMLESAGYRLGLVSNAGDDEDVRTLARNFGIDRSFDFILTSAACSYRKPHSRIFELALRHWGFPASETAMVGDALEADILGAKRAGMFSIWYTAHVSMIPEASEIKPDAIASHLLEVPELLTRMS